MATETEISLAPGSSCFAGWNLMLILSSTAAFLKRLPSQSIHPVDQCPAGRYRSDSMPAPASRQRCSDARMQRPEPAELGSVVVAREPDRKGLGGRVDADEKRRRWQSRGGWVLARGEKKKEDSTKRSRRNVRSIYRSVESMQSSRDQNRRNEWRRARG